MEPREPFKPPRNAQQQADFLKHCKQTLLEYGAAHEENEELFELKDVPASDNVVYVNFRSKEGFNPHD